MRWFHGTTQAAWLDIQREGVLFGVRHVPDSEFNPSRCTYLTPDYEVAARYGEIVLEVEYDPVNRTDAVGSLNNFHPESWQMRVYEPIQLANVCNASQNASTVKDPK